MLQESLASDGLRDARRSSASSPSVFDATLHAFEEREAGRQPRLACTAFDHRDFLVASSTASVFRSGFCDTVAAVDQDQAACPRRGHERADRVLPACCKAQGWQRADAPSENGPASRTSRKATLTLAENKSGLSCFCSRTIYRLMMRTAPPKTSEAPPTMISASMKIGVQLQGGLRRTSQAPAQVPGHGANAHHDGQEKKLQRQRVEGAEEGSTLAMIHKHGDHAPSVASSAGPARPRPMSIGMTSSMPAPMITEERKPNSAGDGDDLRFWTA